MPGLIVTPVKTGVHPRPLNLDTVFQRYDGHGPSPGCRQKFILSLSKDRHDETSLRLRLRMTPYSLDRHPRPYFPTDLINPVFSNSSMKPVSMNSSGLWFFALGLVSAIKLNEFSMPCKFTLGIFLIYRDVNRS
jgi:hypothetical protein